jgi:outer membrane biosynthesis protein TonB
MTTRLSLLAATLLGAAAFSAQATTPITFTRTEVAQMALLWETDTIAVSPLADAQYPVYNNSLWQFIFPHTGISADGDVHTDMAIDSSGTGSTGNNTGASPIVCEVINATSTQLSHLNALRTAQAIFRGIFRFYTEHAGERHFELHPLTELDTWNGSGFVLDSDYHSTIVADPNGTTHSNATLIGVIDGTATLTATIESDNTKVDFVFPSPSVNYVQYAGIALSGVTSDATSSYFLFRPNLVPSATLRCRLVANTAAATAAAGLTVNQSVTVNALTRNDMGFVSSQIASLTAGQMATFPRTVELIVLGLPGLGPPPTPTPTATATATATPAATATATATAAPTPTPSPTPIPTATPTPAATPTPTCCMFTGTVGTDCQYHPAGGLYDISINALINNPCGQTQMQAANFYLEGSTDGTSFVFIARTSIQNYTFQPGPNPINESLLNQSIAEQYQYYRVRMQIYACGIYEIYSPAAPVCRPGPTPTPTATATATPTAAATATPTATATSTPTATATATATPIHTPTPTPTPATTPTTTPTPTPILTPSPTPVATSTPAPTPTPTPAPSATPTPTAAAQALNLSTRMRVQTGDNVGIGGFIITGTAPKHVLLRGIGPSLAQFGVPNVLADPILELHGPDAFVTITDDNWMDDPAQKAAILATGIPPANDLESAIDATLNPGAYTAVVRGKNNTSGVGLVEVYDLSQAVLAKLANISTRAFVSTGDNIVIGGFLLGGHTGEDRIVVRGIGPSLTALGVPNVLANPTLELRDGNGALIIANNDWQDNPAQAAELTAAGLAPANNLESGIATTLPPGLYTALLAGLNNGTGVGLVEVYDRGP